MRIPFFRLTLLISFIALLGLSLYFIQSQKDSYYLEKIIERLRADSRIAEIIVTKVEEDPETGKTYTTIKFLEYDTDLNPLKPKYFTFTGNIIQFQSMVIRFDDLLVKQGHSLKGKSAYLFMKAFQLTDNGAEVFNITKINQIPSGYRVSDAKNTFEEKLWQKFWDYALDSEKATKAGIKNAQIEAPGTKFIPGLIYTLKIEHSGGLRIDCQPIPTILQDNFQY